MKGNKDVINALNEVLRNEYIKDCQRGVDRWNKTIKDEGITFELTLPSNKFHRQIGMWSTMCFDPAGNLIDRVFMGSVVDFVDAYWGTFHFWAFNVADSAITVGVVFMILDMIGTGTHASNPA